MSAPGERLFVALDRPTLDDALALVDGLAGLVERFKVGLELFAAVGPGAVTAIRAAGGRVFLDLKLHDIPETVRRAAHAASATGAEWLTVHSAGGLAMLRAAVDGAGDAKVLAVTVLTSLDLADLAATGCASPSVEALVVQRARLAREAGCAGVVASPREARALREALGPGFLIVTPGVRPSSVTDGDDQKRTASPREAIAAGADAVVVGRPITGAPDPRAAAHSILEALG